MAPKLKRRLPSGASAIPHASSYIIRSILAASLILRTPAKISRDTSTGGGHRAGRRTLVFYPKRTHTRLAYPEYSFWAPKVSVTRLPRADDGGLRGIRRRSGNVQGVRLLRKYQPGVAAIGALVQCLSKLLVHRYATGPAVHMPPGLKWLLAVSQAHEGGIIL